MPASSYMERHTAAMLNPETETERTVVTLFAEMSRLADKFANDSVMVAVIEHIGSALIALGNWNLDRLDPGTLDKQIRDVVQRAGGDTNDL